MEDDFYGNQEDIPEVEKERLDREVQSVRREFVKAGIREGASSAREAHLQGGFDDGFAAGAKAAAAGGYLLGVCSVLDAFYERQGCNRESSERSQRVGDTEILTSDLKDVAECIPELRSALRSLPVDRTVSTEKAQKAADKIAVIPIPNFKTGNSESAASH